MTTAAAANGSVDVSWRIAAFVFAAAIVGPVLDYGFGFITQRPILFAFPLVAVLLIAMSYVFGLWNRDTGAMIKLASVLWSVLVAWLNTVMLLFLFCYVGALLHIPDTCI